MSLKWRLYGLFRPIVRPAMWRLRTFFVGRSHDEIAELRVEIGRLRNLIEEHQQPPALDTLVDQRVREIMAQALVTLALDRETPDQTSDDLPLST